MLSERASQRAFLTLSAALFAISAAATIGWTLSMSAMGMPAMGEMPLCGQTVPEAAAAFLGMWIVMTAAMMLPSLAPMLWGYREAIRGAAGPRLGWLTALASAGYFSVWTVLGMAVSSLDAALAALGNELPALARVAPIAAGMVVLIAGAFQLTPWKAHHLACCRESPRSALPQRTDAVTAWRLGLRLGRHCIHSCAGLTAVLLVAGVMDLRVMTVTTAAITVERLAPAGERIARAIGGVIVGAGLFMVARAIGLG